jgi:pyruvate formate lyase activating enzyme
MAVHVDPIEKKPLYHFLPGSRAYSLATSGCPLRCKFCQNWQLSRASPEDYSTAVAPPAAVSSAAHARNAPVIAFTYNEPTVFTEYLTDIARAAREQDIRSVLISCGYMQEAPLDEMCDVLAAIKIDLKGINPTFYRDVCNADVTAVQRSIKQVAKRGVHLEIVNLVVPTLNDSDKDLRQLARWLHDEVGPDVPVHFTRFHPDFKLRNLPPTPVSTLERAHQMALDVGLRYPFVGNVPGHAGNHSHCPKCKKVVIERHGFFIKNNHVAKGRCEFCQEKIAGVWE